MIKTKLSFLVLLITIINVSAQDTCMTAERLKNLDASWEQSLIETNLEYFESTIAEDFIWVHNHAGRTDNKKNLLDLVRKVRNEKPEYWKSRNQKDVQVIIVNNTGIVTGYTQVELYDGSSINYNFMRTYAEKEGKCYLVANHTMVVPAEEKN